MEGIHEFVEKSHPHATSPLTMPQENIKFYLSFDKKIILLQGPKDSLV